MSKKEKEGRDVDGRKEGMELQEARKKGCQRNEVRRGFEGRNEGRKEGMLDKGRKEEILSGESKEGKI